MPEIRRTPRVMRRGDQPTAQPAPEAEAEAPVQQQRQAPMSVDSDDNFYTGTLSSGRVVTLREMTASDLLYLEKSLGNLGDMERSLKLATRLSTGEGKVSFEDLTRLKMKDLRVVTDLLAQAGNTGDDFDAEMDPNE